MGSSQPRGAKTIILAEDYEMLRGVTKVLLESYGYRVIEAEDGREAVDALGRDPDGVDLVMLDVAMPKMGGLEAYEEMSSIKPGLKAIFTSGSDADVSRLGGKEFLSKPSSPDKIIRKIRELLGS